jgi:hypothetical protein
MRYTSTNIFQAKESFWKRAGGNNIFPCDIMKAVSRALPLDIVSLSELSLQKVQCWLNQKKVIIDLDINDRLLHGFILISKGTGFIFLNGTDSEKERRYTIAHEAGHYLLDYERPRKDAIAKLGKGIVEVLDGLRDATTEEQIDGVLASVSLKPYTHLLEKVGDGSFSNMDILNSENDADALALELLSPSSIVIRDTNPNKDKLSFFDFKNLCYHILRNKYLIPDSIAETYSSRLANIAVGFPSLAEKLGF